MKYIISCLVIVLAFSFFMAIKTDIENHNLEWAALKVEPPASPDQPAQPDFPYAPESPKAPTVPPSEPKQEEVYVYEEDLDEEMYAEEDFSENPVEKPTWAPLSTIEREIAEAFGTERRIALAVAKAESGLNPKAVNKNRNGSKDIGIFQINDQHGWSANDRFDWRKNIWMAKELRDRHGWTEWAVYNNGSYRKFL